MNYENCLKICVELNQDLPYFQERYQDYPVPAQNIWKQCVSEAKMILVDAADAEIVIEQALPMKGVPLETLVAEVNRTAEFGLNKFNANSLVEVQP